MNITQFKFTLFCISFFLISLLCSLSAYANEGEKIVRVGFFILPGFHEYDFNGKPSGYDVEYLEKLSEYTNWKYEYINADSWDDALEMLENNEIDLLAPAQMTLERREKFLFSNNSFGREYGSLLTWTGNDSLTYEQFDSFSDIKIGCTNSFIMKDNFFRYAENNGFIPNMEYYNSTNELLSAIDNRKIDAALFTLAMADDSKKVLAKFAPSSYYYITNKQNQSLMDELNYALDELKVDNPDFENELTDEFFPHFRKTPYTNAEIDYIKNAPTFRVGYLATREPISYLDKEGNAKGILIDIMNVISAKSGLKFEYVPLYGESIVYDDLREKNLSMIIGVEYTRNNIKAPGMKLSNPFFVSSKVLVGKKGLRFSKASNLRMAISTGSQTLPYTLKEKYPNFEIINFPSTNDCLEAVSQNKADVMLQSQYAVEKLLAKPKYEKLTIIPDTGLEEELSLSILYFSKGKNTPDELLTDPRLLSSINKTIADVDGSIVSNIIISYTSAIPYEITISDIIYRYRIAIIIISLITLVAIFLVYYAVKMHNINMNIIRNNEKELRCITNNINGGVIVLIPDKGFTIQYANSGFIKMIGADNEYADIVQRGSYITYVHKDDIQKLNDLMKDNLENGAELELELNIRRIDGEYIPVIFKGTVSKDNDKIKIYCVVMDISEQKRMIDSLAIEKERYDMIFEQTDDIIFDANIQDHYIIFSEQFEKNFGWNPNKFKMLGDLSELHVHKDDLAEYMKLEREIRNSKEVINARMRIQKKSGEYVWCDITLKCIRLKNILVRIVGKITDVDEIVKEYERLESISSKDSLTGIFNKEAFKTKVELYLKDNDISNGCTMLFIDIDNFKALNDTLGHMTGDIALKDIVTIIKSSFDENNIIGRFGGDEFFVFSKNISLQEFFRKLERLKVLLMKTYHDKEKNLSVSISASMGFTYSSSNNITYDELLKQSDLALYAAKEQGKNRYVMYHDEIVVNGYTGNR